MNMIGEISNFGDSKLDDLLLCLYIKDTKQCVSSIEIYEQGNNISINSSTNKNYEGRKYNILMRAAVIDIFGDSPYRNVESLAVNPISAYILLTKFNGKIVDEDENLLKSPITVDFLNEYYNLPRHKDLKILVEMSEQNIATAKNVFHDTLSKITNIPDDPGITATKRGGKKSKKSRRSGKHGGITKVGIHKKNYRKTNRSEAKRNSRKRNKYGVKRTLR